MLSLKALQSWCRGRLMGCDLKNKTHCHKAAAEM